jgi:molybdate transport system ATP-binding protein
MIEIAVKHRLGSFELDVTCATQARLTAVFGQSGSGKTTLINMIAGLINPREGYIKIDGQILFDSQKSINVPVYRRRIGCVFQDARLFPHMTVQQNLDYGQWFSPGVANKSSIVEILGLGQLLKRMPYHLSGGEKQRVAIGRALFCNPKLLVMDEPLASLDQARKEEILTYIEMLRDITNIPVIYVSHSAVEVERLASEVIVMAEGKLVMTGSPQNIYTIPPPPAATAGLSSAIF